MTRIGSLQRLVGATLIGGTLLNVGRPAQAPAAQQSEMIALPLEGVPQGPGLVLNANVPPATRAAVRQQLEAALSVVRLDPSVLVLLGHTSLGVSFAKDVAAFARNAVP